MLLGSNACLKSFRPLVMRNISPHIGLHQRISKETKNSFQTGIRLFLLPGIAILCKGLIMAAVFIV